MTTNQPQNNISSKWIEKELGEVASFFNGKAHENDISDNGRYIVINSKFVSTNGLIAKYTNTCLSPLKKADIAMVMSDVPNGKAIAKCFLIDADHKYTLNQRIGGFRSKEINSSFLYFLLNRNRYFLSFDDGVNQTNLRKDDILECPLYYPPLPEQNRIVSVLETWDQAIETLTKKIEMKRQIKKGLMQDLLTGQKRLGGFKGDWRTVKLGTCLFIKHGKPQKDVESANGQYPILGTGGEFGRATKFLYDKPSVLIGRKGTIDKPKYMDQPFWTVDTLFYSEIKKCNNAKFLYYLFLTINWKLYNEGSGVPSLSASTIATIKVFIPMEENEQTAIANILTAADNEITTLQNKLSLLKDQKKYLLNNLITGAIRTPEDLTVRS